VVTIPQAVRCVATREYNVHDFKNQENVTIPQAVRCVATVTTRLT